MLVGDPARITRSQCAAYGALRSLLRPPSPSAPPSVPSSVRRACIVGVPGVRERAGGCAPALAP
eukprot:26226-Pleurochrysis_carterae.AAC.1